MTLPNFLIVGAPKSGTTSLYRYLQDHPQVFLPEVKEPGFFAEGGARKVQTLSEYEALFAAADTPAIGEASVTYLYDPHAASRIRGVLGADTRILILLRNPVDKAHSLWGHMVGLGAEELSFSEALAAEKERLTGASPLPPGNPAPTYYAYLSRAQYTPQVRRYLETFPRDRVRVEIFEEFFADPARAYAGICEFLGVGADHTPRFEVHNRSGRVRFPFLGQLVNRRARWKEPFKALLPLSVRVRILTWVNRWNRARRPLPPVTAEERERLQKFFADDVRALEKLLSRSLSEVWW
jgi:hypothetical protein